MRESDNSDTGDYISQGCHIKEMVASGIQSARLSIEADYCQRPGGLQVINSPATRPCFLSTKKNITLKMAALIATAASYHTRGRHLLQILLRALDITW